MNKDTEKFDNKIWKRLIKICKKSVIKTGEMTAPAFLYVLLEVINIIFKRCLNLYLCIKKTYMYMTCKKIGGGILRTGTSYMSSF